MPNSTLSKFQERVGQEDHCEVKEKARQGCFVKLRGNEYWAWLVDETHDTLFHNEKFFKEHRGFYNNSNFYGLNRLCKGPMATPTIYELETTKRTKKGRELFKEILPDLPLAQQINKAYGKHPALSSLGVINRNISPVSFQIWPSSETELKDDGSTKDSVVKESLEKPHITGMDAVPVFEGVSGSVEEPMSKEDTEIIVENNDFFKRHEISQKKSRNS